MGIDIYAHWRNQSDEARDEQLSAWPSSVAGGKGYLREAYHGEPYATRFLCAEAFESDEAQIPAAVFRERLSHTLTLAEERERKLYGGSVEDIEQAKQSYRDFVALCEEKEKETDEPVRIVASF